MDKGVFRYPDGVVPMQHQQEAMKKAWKLKSFAFFLEMGCGKTFTTIALAGHRFNRGLIDAVLVIVPTSIKIVWQREVAKMSPVPAVCHVHEAGKNVATEKFIELETDELKYLVVGVEALSKGSAYVFADDFVSKHTCMAVVDESSRIKNPSASRTKHAIKIGKLAKYRLILTGTPITQGIIDLFSQFKFLNEDIIGCKSFYVFRNLYCIMGGYENRQILGYQREEELVEKVSPYVYQVKKEQCLDLPDKVYQTLYVDATKEQKKALKELHDFFEVDIGGDILTINTVLERLTRSQQILGGHFPFNDEDNISYRVKKVEGKNPKLDALMESVEDLDENVKVIIWARFRPEIETIAKALRERFGKEQVIEYHGGISERERNEAIVRFQDMDNPARFFVANQQTAGMGLTLTAATYAYYYSNSFSLEQRMQSEDRNHRKGQDNKCTYIDIVCKEKADTMIIKALQGKQSLSEYVSKELERRK